MQSKIRSGAINEVSTYLIEMCPNGLSSLLIIVQFCPLRSEWILTVASPDDKLIYLNFLHLLNVVQERGGIDVGGGPFIYKVKYFFWGD